SNTIQADANGEHQADNHLLTCGGVLVTMSPENDNDQLENTTAIMQQNEHVNEWRIDTEFENSQFNECKVKEHGFGCPWNADRCHNHCRSIGRKGGYCGGTMRKTCYCYRD
ncbi:defensin-1-like protein, partial [Leptotrombidium deliense]